MLSCSDLTMRSSPPLCVPGVLGAGRLGRRQSLSEVLEPFRDLLLVHRLQKTIERGLREQEAQEEPQQPIQAGRPDLLGTAALIARGTAHAGRDAAHLEAPRVQLLETCACVRRQPGEHRHERHRGRFSGCAAGRGVLARGMHLGVDRRSEPGNRDQPGQIGQLSGGHQRQEHSGKRRQRGRGGAAQQEQQVPPEEKRFLEIVGHPRAPGRVPGRIVTRWHVHHGSFEGRSGHSPSVARARRRRHAVEHVGELEHPLDERRFTLHLLGRTVRRRHAHLSHDRAG